jgi:hypothetical protein
VLLKIGFGSSLCIFFSPLSDFPSHVVAEAYAKPQVDESTEKFAFSVPDIKGIRDFMREKLGWPSAKTDEALLPVLNKMNLFGVRFAGNKILH